MTFKSFGNFITSCLSVNVKSHLADGSEGHGPFMKWFGLEGDSNVEKKNRVKLTDWQFFVEVSPHSGKGTKPIKR